MKLLAMIIPLFIAMCGGGAYQKEPRENNESNNRTEEAATVPTGEAKTTEEQLPPVLPDEDQLARQVNTFLEEQKLNIIEKFPYQSSSIEYEELNKWEKKIEFREHFDYQEFLPASSGQMTMAEFLSMVLEKHLPGYKLEICGYDDLMNVSHHVTSKRRAESVLELLTANGFSSKRVEIAGRGDKNPVRRGFNREGYDPNRRVELKLVPN